VLQYLGRYTHRVAISNHRLVSFADGKVTFRWRDSAHNNEQKLMTLSLDEFLRRFLLHLLPEGFVRIRNFGFLANRKRATTLPLCFQLLSAAPQPSKRSPPPVRVIFGLAPSVVGRCWSSKDLLLLRSSFVLHRPRMPSPHETTIDITKPLRASARCLPLCLLAQPIPFSRFPRSPFCGISDFSATLLRPQLGAVLCCTSPVHRQTHSSHN